MDFLPSEGFWNPEALFDQMDGANGFKTVKISTSAKIPT